MVQPLKNGLHSRTRRPRRRTRELLLCKVCLSYLRDPAKTERLTSASLCKTTELVESSIPVSPYSKSHNKRLKRKAKQSLGLDSMTAALDEAMPEDSTSVSTSAFATATATAHPAAIKNTAPPPESFLAKRSKAENKQLTQKAKTAPNKIGEYTVNKGLTSRQRQKML